MSKVKAVLRPYLSGLRINLSNKPNLIFLIRHCLCSISYIYSSYLQLVKYIQNRLCDTLSKYYCLHSSNSRVNFLYNKVLNFNSAFEPEIPIFLFILQLHKSFICYKVIRENFRKHWKWF